MGLDSFVFGGLLSCLVALFLLFCVPSLIIAALVLRIVGKPSWSEFISCIKFIAICAFLVAVVFGITKANNRLAQDRAEIMVSAVRAFHAKYQYYPDDLGQLVPEFIDAVPRAKYELWGDFFYGKSGDAPILGYVDKWPVRFRVFRFADKEWGSDNTWDLLD